MKLLVVEDEESLLQSIVDLFTSKLSAFILLIKCLIQKFYSLN